MAVGGKNEEEQVTLLADNLVFMLVRHLPVHRCGACPSPGICHGPGSSYLSEGVGNASNRGVRRSLGDAAFLHPNSDRTVALSQRVLMGARLWPFAS